MLDRPAPDRRTLNGWKEIAGYLGKSVRSVQRWELTLQLPVHRIKTADGQTVYAHTDELDRWRQDLDVVPEDRPPAPLTPPEAFAESARVELIEPSSRRRRRIPALLLAALTLFASGALWGHRQARSADLPTEFRVVGNRLQALTSEGVELWSHDFGRDVMPPSESARMAPFVVDLDDDGEMEVLALIRSALPGRQPMMSDGVFCFRANGELRWTAVPGETLWFDGQSYGAPWLVEDIALSQTGPDRRIWIALTHNTWWPSYVLEIAPDGRTAVKYVQPGRIASLAHWVTPAGGILAIGGTINSNDRATLVLLHDGDPPASFPGPPDGYLACSRCPTAQPRKVIQFGVSEVAGLFTNHVPYVMALSVRGNVLRADVNEAPLKGARAIATLSPNLALTTMSYGDAFWRLHRDLEEAGRLHHAFESCPERHRARVAREWTPTHGWRELAVQADPAARQNGERLARGEP
jgi:hypothetical protein